MCEHTYIPFNFYDNIWYLLSAFILNAFICMNNLYNPHNNCIIKLSFTFLLIRKQNHSEKLAFSESDPLNVGNIYSRQHS